MHNEHLNVCACTKNALLLIRTVADQGLQRFAGQVAFRFRSSDDQIMDVGIRVDIADDRLKTDILGLHRARQGITRFDPSPYNTLEVGRDLIGADVQDDRACDRRTVVALRYLPSSGG